MHNSFMVELKFDKFDEYFSYEAYNKVFPVKLLHYTVANTHWCTLSYMIM